MEGGCDGGVIRSGGIGILLVVQPGGEVDGGFGAARFGVQLGQGRFGGLSCGLLRGLGFFGFRGPAGRLSDPLNSHKTSYGLDTCRQPWYT